VRHPQHHAAGDAGARGGERRHVDAIDVVGDADHVRATVAYVGGVDVPWSALHGARRNAVYLRQLRPALRSRQARQYAGPGKVITTI
jgi:hypothetical protein